MLNQSNLKVGAENLQTCWYPITFQISDLEVLKFFFNVQKLPDFLQPL